MSYGGFVCAALGVVSELNFITQADQLEHMFFLPLCHDSDSDSDNLFA